MRSAATGPRIRNICSWLRRGGWCGVLAAATAIKGCSLPLLRMYWKNRRVKVELGVGKGKTHSDQREDLKKKVELREAQREMSRFNQR